MMRLAIVTVVVVGGLTLGLQPAAVAAGAPHTRASTTAPTHPSTLFVWGDGHLGQFGNGVAGAPDTCNPYGTVCSTLPVRVGLPTGVSPVIVNSGARAGYALGSDGVLYAWGDNRDGQLGDGTTGSSSTCASNFGDNPCQPTPVPVALPAGVTVVALASGDIDGYALGSNGAVYAWGDAGYGELGVASVITSACDDGPCRVTPVRVELPAGVAATAIAADGEAAYAIGSNHVLYSWGNGSSTPVAVSLGTGVTPTSVAAGIEAAYAIGSNGALYAWGQNSYGELGSATLASSATPVKAPLPTGVTPRDLVAGEYAAYFVGSDGKLYGWGGNFAGQLGLGETSGPQTCNQGACDPTPTPVGLPSGFAFTALAADNNDAYALGADGTLLGWGMDDEGQMGDGALGPTICTFFPCLSTPTAATAPGGGRFVTLASGAGDPYVGVTFAATAPPTCELVDTIAGPPKQIEIAVQGTASGVATIAVTRRTNAVVTVPSFTPGTLAPIVVTATKVDSAKESIVALRVSGEGGDVSTCA